MFTFNDVKNAMLSAITDDSQLKTVKSAFENTLSYYDLSTNEYINNYYLIVYLSTFLNFFAQYGALKFSLDFTASYDNNKDALYDTITKTPEYIDPDLGNVRAGAIACFNHIGGDTLKTEFIVGDSTFKVLSSYELDYNWEENNYTYNYGDSTNNNELSDGYVSQDILEKLMTNLVLFKMSKKKIQISLHNMAQSLAQLTAICSSSSSSSSSAFIAYMKLA